MTEARRRRMHEVQAVPLADGEELQGVTQVPGGGVDYGAFGEGPPLPLPGDALEPRRVESAPPKPPSSVSTTRCMLLVGVGIAVVVGVVVIVASLATPDDSDGTGGTQSTTNPELPQDMCRTTPPPIPTDNLSAAAIRCLSLLKESPDYGERELDRSLEPGVTFHEIPVADGPTPAWTRNGTQRGVAEWVMPATDRSGGKARVVFAHGGSYQYYSPRDVYRQLTSRLAATLGLPVLSVDYRLAPEHIFPAALIDTAAALRWASNNTPPGGGATGAGVKLALVGDSAGGGLAVASALAAAGAGGSNADLMLPAEAMPAAVATVSAWLDLTCSCPAYCTRWKQDFLYGVPPPECGREASQKSAAVYLGTPPLSDGYPSGYSPVLASPLFVSDEVLRRAPAMLLLVGDAEVLLSENAVLAERAQAAGNSKVQWRAYAGMWHDWVCYAGEACANACAADGCPKLEMPEGTRALQEIADFVRQHLAVA